MNVDSQQQFDTRMSRGGAMSNCANPDCPHCPLDPATEFDHSATAPSGDICATRVVRSFDPESTLFVEGSPVVGAFCICSGGVILRKRDANGIEHDISRMGPGAILGFRQPTGRGEYLVTAVAHSTVTACFIPIEEMVDLVNRYPVILLRLARSFCQRIGELRDRAA
jgi:CRP-like cAMP-binding protein